MSELEALRSEISELDRRLLELLNRRLELVASVRDYKDSAGERWIDPEREADLLQLRELGGVRSASGGMGAGHCRSARARHDG